MLSPIFAALALGLATIPHCVGMCGPLAAHAGCGAGKSPSYHGARMASLLLLGALAGQVGETVVLAVAPSLAQTLGSAFVALTLAFAAYRYARPAASPLIPLSRLRKGANHARALSLGALTPLLPCASVWSLLMLCVGSASPLTGALAALAFFLPSAAAVELAARSVRRLGASHRRGFALVLALGALVTALRPLQAAAEFCIAP